MFVKIIPTFVGWLNLVPGASDLYGYIRLCVAHDEVHELWTSIKLLADWIRLVWTNFIGISVILTVLLLIWNFWFRLHLVGWLQMIPRLLYSQLLFFNDVLMLFCLSMGRLGFRFWEHDQSEWIFEKHEFIRNFFEIGESKIGNLINVLKPQPLKRQHQIDPNSNPYFWKI